MATIKLDNSQSFVRRPIISFIRATTAVAFSLFAPATINAAEQTKIVRSADDLPRHSYPVEGRLADIISNDAAFRPIADKLRRDTEATLANYRIDDRATLRSLHRVLLNLAMLRGDVSVARSEIDTIHSLQDKEADKLTTGLREAAYLDAMSAGPAGSNAFKLQYQRSYSAALASLPWAKVGSEIQKSAGTAPVVTIRYIKGIAETKLQPAVTSGKSLDAEAAAYFVLLTAHYRLYTPLADQTVAALQGYIDKYAVAKPDIWAARTAVLPPAAKLTPVTIAVWDSGVDTAQFKGQLWTNPKEQANGKDDDNNGYIDDIHGIAYDVNGHKDIAPLGPVPDDIAPRLDATRLSIQGMMDQQARIASEDAKRLREFATSASPDVIKQTFKDMDFYNVYAHGTHVAGIVANGNPSIRLLVTRLQFEWRTPPARPTEASATAYANMYRDVVTYMKRAGVRVVNMSWGVDLKEEYEDALAANGVPPGEREAEARRLFAIDSQGLRDAIASAPDILFICAAGNSNDSAAFTGYVPASIDAPNVLTVAAVDQAGEPTAFTSGGPTVDIAASGYQVDSVLPGGNHQRWSGTSMASPAVVNAAAKLLAVNPKLSVAQLRQILLDTATPGTGGLHLLDARAALAKVDMQ